MTVVVYNPQDKRGLHSLQNLLCLDVEYPCIYKVMHPLQMFESIPDLALSCWNKLFEDS